MLSDARSEVSACFTDVTSITTCTGKFIYNARTEPIRERIFHVKQVLNFTFTGVLTNFLSFTPLCYKLGLVKTLIDRIFKINNTWLGFHKDIQKLFVILRKNLYPEHVLNSIIHRYISKAVKGENARPVAGVEPQESPKFYFKIPYIGRFSDIAQHRVRTLINRFCKPVDIKLVFSTFKIKNLFNVKESLPDRLRTRVVYKFSCASCNACYIGETSRHFATRVLRPSTFGRLRSGARALYFTVETFKLYTRFKFKKIEEP